MEKAGSSEPCDQCPPDKWRSQPSPWIKPDAVNDAVGSIYSENSCEECPSPGSFVIRQHADRHTYKNCKCLDDHFFQYSNNVAANPQKKRGICPYSEITQKQLPPAMCTCQPCSKQDPQSLINEKGTNCSGGYFGLLPGFSVLKSSMLGPADADIAALLNGNISDKVYKCKRPEACINNGTCNEALGYTGVLCAECAPGFGLMPQNKCGECLPESFNRFVVSLMAIGMLFVVVFMAYGSKAPASDLSAIQKILVNHLSFLSFIGQMSLAWGNIFNEYIFQSASVASDVASASPIDCVFVGDFKSKFFVWMSFPVIGLLIPAVFNTVQYQASRQVRKLAGKSAFVENLLGSKSTRIIITETAVVKSNSMPSSHAVAFANRNRVLRAAQDDDDARELRINSLLIFFVSLYFFYPMLTKMIFDAMNVFTIEPLDDVPGVVINRLEAIPMVDTTRFDYKSVIFPLSIVFLIIYGFCIPIALVLAMRWKQEARLGGGSMTIIFNFMTQGYRFETYYWESYVMVRKLVISAVIAFLSQNTLYQSYGLLAAMVINLLMTIFLKPYRAVQGFSLDVASTTVLHITILAGIVLTSKLDTKLPLLEQPTLVAVTIVAVTANFLMILVLLGYVLFDKLDGQEFRGVPLILYFRYYSPRVREEIRHLQNSHANFIASLESKHYNKLSFDQFTAVTAKEGNAFRRAYHKKQSLAHALREKDLADAHGLNVLSDEEVGRLASSSSSELTVTPTHSSPASDARSKSGSTSGSISTESSDAHLSDSDDSQRAPALTRGALLTVPKLALSENKVGNRPFQFPSRDRVARSQEPDLKPSFSAVPNLRGPLVPSLRASFTGSVGSIASQVGLPFAASVSPRKPHDNGSTIFSTNVAHAFVPSVSPPTSLEHPASAKLSDSSFQSARIMRALASNRTVNVGSSSRQSSFGADVPLPARPAPQLSDSSAVAPASADFSAAAPPMRNMKFATAGSSSSSSRNIVPAAQRASLPVESPRDSSPPPPPFPIDFMTPRDIPPPLPHDAHKQRSSDRSSAISSLREPSPPPPPRQSPPPFSPPETRRSNSRSASAFHMDEPPPLPPPSVRARRR